MPLSEAIAIRCMSTHAQSAFAPDPLWLPPLLLDMDNPSCPLEEALLYHRPGRFGFFSILRQVKTILKEDKLIPVREQRTYRLSELRQVLGQLAGQPDVWIAQNEYTKPNRQSRNLGLLCVCFVDVDYYKCKVTTWDRPEQVAVALLDYLDQHGIPRPSVIVASGRGLQIKWLLEPLPAEALPRWNAVQKELTQKLAEFGADPQAKDSSRVLRLVGTINSRSGTMVRVIYADTTRMHDFDQLADAVLPLPRKQLQAEREARLLVFRGDKPKPKERQEPRAEITGLRQKSVRQLWQARLDDLHTLAKLRGWLAGAPEGMQDITLWIATCATAWTQPSPWINKAKATLAKAFTPTWSETETHAVLSSTCNRQLQAERGEVITFNGVEVDPRYRLKNETLIELLRITAEEQRHMTTIISREEKLRRGRERKRNARRNAGVIDRQAYLGIAANRKTEALALRLQGKTWQEVAKAVRYSSAASARIACR